MPDINSRDTTNQRLLTNCRSPSPFQIPDIVGMPGLYKPICSSSVLVRLKGREHMAYTPINSMMPEFGKQFRYIDSEI